MLKHCLIIFLIGWSDSGCASGLDITGFTQLESAMLLAHKIALDPNAAQRLYFARAAGTARFAWNWALRDRSIRDIFEAVEDPVAVP